jgi:hypothetical protein
VHSYLNRLVLEVRRRLLILWRLLVDVAASNGYHYTDFSKGTRGLERISYRGALLSTFLHAIKEVVHDFLNVLIQTENKIGLQEMIQTLLYVSFIRYTFLYYVSILIRFYINIDQVL